MSNGNPVLGLAELLTPALDTFKCLQPFKFIMIDDDDYQRLGSLIRSSLGLGPAASGDRDSLKSEPHLAAAGTLPSGGAGMNGPIRP